MTTETAFRDRCQEVITAFPRLAAELFDIRTQDQGFQRLRANAVQRDYQTDRIARGYSSADDILKARKHGITTWKVLEGLLLALLVDGWSGGMLMHETQAAARVFKIAKYAYERLPQSYRDLRQLNEDRRDAIDFGGSTLYVYTAGSRRSGRSETFHWLHCSEVAFWREPLETLTAAVEAVPRFGHICKESTPNGRNYWYDECRAARQGEIAGTKLYFYPWWWGAENWLPLDEGELIIPTDEEQTAIDLAGRGGFVLRPEQLKWRRSKRSHPLTGKMFPQEHPEDPESCFLASGSPIIDPEVIMRHLSRAEAQTPMEDIWAPGGGRKITWRHRSGTAPVVVSVDVAEGLAHGDWSVISSWQLLPQGMLNLSRQNLHCTPDELALRTVQEAREQADALVIVERNSIGGEVVRKIDLLGYFNQYHQIDKDGHRTSHLGWRSDWVSKRLMVEQYVGEVNAGNVTSYDSEVWSQALNVTRDEMGKPLFPAKKHDDILITAMLANMAREQAQERTGAGGATIVSFA